MRSSLALSLVTGKPVTLSNIRAGRKKPGLQRQHLTAVKAAAAISEAETDGASVSSTELNLVPGQIKPGEYKFDVGTAGSVTLVLQTILPALMLADTPSSLILEGGTHNSMAPPFEFLQNAFLPLVGRMGPRVEVTLDRYGFYPRGGGRLSVSIRPVPQLRGLALMERGELTERRVRAMVSNLPTHIARRQCETIARKSRWKDSCFKVQEVTDASGPGNVLLIELEFEHVTEVFAGFGQKGIKAEHIAARVWNDVRSYLKNDVPVGAYLADQLMLPMGIAASQGRPSQFRTAALTRHATTHIQILKSFLPVEIQVDERGPHDFIVNFKPA